MPPAPYRPMPLWPPEPPPANQTMKIIEAKDHQSAEGQAGVLALDNTVDPQTLSLEGISRIDLHFPKFTDGRAYSQAYLLRRRLAFTGEIRATGDVLIDQLVQMSRSGFDVAVLRAGVDIADAQRQFDRFSGFYQADAVNTRPLFARQAA